jgi:hypothetical protein
MATARGADEDDGSNGGNATPRRWRLSANSLDTKLSRRVSDDGLTLQCFLLDEAARLLRSRSL